MIPVNDEVYEIAAQYAHAVKQNYVSAVFLSGHYILFIIRNNNLLSAAGVNR